jgi:hypothetical protein
VPSITTASPKDGSTKPPNYGAYNIYLALPAGTFESHSMQRILIMSSTKRAYRCTPTSGSSSSLTANFNQSWTDAVNGRKSPENPQGYTHFLMLHSDILPKGHWIDKLMDTLMDNQLEVLSVVSPIKDDHGLTSTGFDTDQFRPRRLCLRETDKLPFIVRNTPEDVRMCEKIVGPPVGPLLINTGLMLIDLSVPWAEKLCFQFRNRVVRRDDGLLHNEFEPEDWLMSRDLHRWGAKFAFVDGRVVELGHAGGMVMMNTGGWGKFDTDKYNIPEAGRTAEVVAGFGAADYTPALVSE